MVKQSPSQIYICEGLCTFIRSKPVHAHNSSKTKLFPNIKNRPSLLTQAHTAVVFAFASCFELHINKRRLSTTLTVHLRLANRLNRKTRPLQPATLALSSKFLSLRRHPIWPYDRHMKILNQSLCNRSGSILKQNMSIRAIDNLHLGRNMAYVCIKNHRNI